MTGSSSSPIHPPISQDELHAHADGQLAPARAEEVEAFLADHPAEAALVAEWRAQNAAIRTLFAVPATPRSADTAALERARPGREKGHLLRSGAMLAAALAFVVGGTGGLGLGWIAGRDGMPRSADARYVAALSETARTDYLVYASDQRRPVEIGADQSDHLVQWLGKRLGTPINAPDLSSTGYHLIGGRLVTFSDGPGALLMYANDAGVRLTVTLGRNEANVEAGFRFAAKGDVHTLTWVDGPVGCVISGPLDEAALRKIADVVYRAI